jgi:O-succinylbenzoate synthase
MNSSTIEIYEYKLPLVGPLHLGGNVLTSRAGLIIKIGRDDRKAGYGDIAPLPGFNPESIEQARDAAIRWADYALELMKSTEDLDDEEVLHSLTATPSVLFGAECAALGLAYAAGATFTDGLFSKTRRYVSINGYINSPTGRAVEKAQFLHDNGYVAAKIKVGRQSVKQDAEMVREVLNIVGDGMELRVDANRAWSYEDAIAFARAVDGVRIAYIEEPLADASRLEEFTKESGMPVALDESIAEGLYEDDFLQDKTWARAVVLKPTLLGGTRTAEDWAAEAVECGIKPVVSSCFESGVGLIALAHLAATITEEDTPAGLDTYDWLAEDLLERRFQAHNGRLDLAELDECAATIRLDRMECIYRV